MEPESGIQFYQHFLWAPEAGERLRTKAGSVWSRAERRGNPAFTPYQLGHLGKAV